MCTEGLSVSEEQAEVAHVLHARITQRAIFRESGS